MNKKSIAAGMLTVLCAVCVISGCGRKNREQPETQKETQQETQTAQQTETTVQSDPQNDDHIEELSTENVVVVDIDDENTEGVNTDQSSDRNEASEGEDILHIVIQEDEQDSSVESIAEYAGSEAENMSEADHEAETEDAMTEDQENSELIKRMKSAYLADEETAGALWCIAYEELDQNVSLSSTEEETEQIEESDTDSVQIIGYREKQSVLSASVIKVFIMGAVYDRICYPAEDMEPIGYTEGYEGELADLLQQMITVSSNEAANRLVEILGDGSFDTGMQVVNDFCKRHGYNGTSLGRRFLGSNAAGDNYVSADDCRQILSDIYYGRLVNEEASEKMLNRLKAQTVKHKIPSGLPAEFGSANKTGEMPDGYGLGCIENDMAIVFTPYGDYILVVLSSELGGRNTQAQTTISGISSLTAQYYLEKKGAAGVLQAEG